MKILTIGPFPPWGVAEADHVFHLCERLANSGADVDVISREGSIQPRHPRIAVHPIIRNWTWPDLNPLLARINASAPDAVLLFYLHQLYGFHPMIRCLPTLAKAAQPDCPFVTLITNGGGTFETLFRAFHLLSSRSELAQLLLIGGSVTFVHWPTYAEEMQAMPRLLGFDSRVRWTGAYPCNSDQASRYLRAADLCVLPFDAGIGLNNSSLSGALAHGLPIVTTQGKHLEPPFVHQENMWLCPPKDSAALAAGIERLMNDAALYRRLQDGARQLFRACFSWESNLEGTLAALSAPRRVPAAQRLEFGWHEIPSAGDTWPGTAATTSNASA